MSLALEAAYARAPVQMVDAPPLRRVADLLREATAILEAEALSVAAAGSQACDDSRAEKAAAYHYALLVDDALTLRTIAYRMETL